MHCGNVWRWYNYTFVAFPRGAAIKPKQSLRATFFWLGLSSLKLNPFSVSRTVGFFLLVVRLAEQVFRSKHFHTFTDLCSALRGTLLCCHIGALVGVLNENVAGKNRSASFLAADVPNEENVSESSLFRTEMAAKYESRLQFYFFTINGAALQVGHRNTDRPR